MFIVWGFLKSIGWIYVMYVYFFIDNWLGFFGIIYIYVNIDYVDLFGFFDMVLFVLFYFIYCFDCC